MIGPGLQIQIESALEQFIPIAGIAGGAERVLEPYRTVFDFGKRQVDIALTGMWRVIHGDQHPFTAGSPPGMGDEGIPGPVPVPGRPARMPLPFPALHDGLSEDREHLVIEALHLLVRRFLRRPNEMR